MIGELIKEYLVGLGVEIDKSGFAELKSTIDRASSTISSSTTGWAKNFTTASTIIATAAAGIGASIAGIMTAAAKQDLAMEKYARQMMVSKGAALEMKTAVDALGESMTDIQITPELYARYKSLVGDGRQMKVGGDYESAMKGFRDLMFEFTRLKQEASYALQWVGYYLMKYLSKPLEEAKASFRTFNDNLIKSMPMWTEKLARALVYIINIGRHFWDLLKSIGKTTYDIWDAFPRGVKIATAALTAFFLILRASPLGRMIALMSSLLLLVDDYFGYMEGKQAAMGPIWDKLNKYIDIAKRTLQEWGRVLAPIWEAFVEYLLEAKDGAIEFGSNFMEWIDEIGKSKNFRDFLDTVKRLGSALDDMGSGVVEFIRKSFEDLFESLRKDKAAQKFTDLMQTLWDIFLGLVDVLSDACDTLGDWFDEMAKSESLMNLIDAVVELFGALMDLIGAFLELCGSVLGEFFEGIGKTESVFSFKDAVKAAVDMLTAMIRAVSRAVKMLGELFSMMKDNRVFKAFWKGLGEVAGEFLNILLRALGAVGRLGLALMALIKLDTKTAAKLGKEGIDLLFGSSKAEASGRKYRFDEDGPTGGLSSLGESGSLEGDPAAFGTDSTGGPSFGAYQIAQKTMPKFITFLESYKPEYAERLDAIGSVDEGDFLTEWVKIAKEDPEGFKKLQHDFIRGNLYDKAVNSILSRTGLDISSMSKTMQEVVWSMAVQHGPGSGIKEDQDDGAARIFERAFNQLGAAAEDEEYIKLLYELRKEYFSKSTPDERQAVWDRYKYRELPAALEMLQQERTNNKKEDEEKNTDGEYQFLNKEGEKPQYELKNPPEGMHDPTLWDRIRDGVGGLGSDVQDFGGWLWDGMSGFGQSTHGTSYLNATKISKYVQQTVAQLDPVTVSNLMSQGASVYPSNYDARNTTNVTYQVDVGGVSVQNTNATPSEIGKAVGYETVQSLEERALYIWQNRSLNGGPSWV